MEIIGYISALFIGLSLGLIGSGGTILALPIFVYLFGIKDMMAATHYSMFVVGVTAFVGAVRKHKEGYVDIRTAIYFLIPSLISLFFTRKIVLPAIPAVIITIGDVVITKNLFLLLLFSIVMLISSISMIRNAKKEDIDCFAKIPDANAHPIQTAAMALLVGALTALVGAGGGFLIIPTLVLLKEHCMKRAIGTSLIIITANSLVGFASDLHVAIQWNMILLFAAIAIVGMLIGIQLSDRLKGATLKRLFGIMVLLMGIYIIFKELFS